MGRTSKYTPISLLELLTLSAGRFVSSRKANAPLCPQGSKIELVMFSSVTTPSSQSQKRYRQTYGLSFIVLHDTCTFDQNIQSYWRSIV